MKKTITQLLKLVILLNISIAFSLNTTVKEIGFNFNIAEKSESQNNFYTLFEKNCENTKDLNANPFWKKDVRIKNDYLKSNIFAPSISLTSSNKFIVDSNKSCLGDRPNATYVSYEFYKKKI
jgi:hypothetical protein